MGISLLEHVAVFANPDGANSHSEGLLKALAQHDGIELTVLGMAEKLPDYARFPSESRKSRIEESLKAAAASAGRELMESSQKLSLNCKELIVLEGRFPTEVVDWVDSSKTTLLIKEPLPYDGDYGIASKGDIKLTRYCSAPVLLARSAAYSGEPVLVGIAPDIGSTNLDRFCISLVETAAFFAKLLGGPLYVVNAWDLFGTSFLRNRVPAEEIAEGLADMKKHSRKAVDRVLSECDLQGLTPEQLLGRGDPTRVLSGAVDLVKPGLVVLGSTAREGVQGVLLGNTAETIARQKQTSVLILR